MMPIILLTPREMQQKIGAQARSKRLDLNLSQKTLSEKSGVSYGVIKKFERTGDIALHSLLKLAMALGTMADFEALFAPTPPEKVLTLDELMRDHSRKRGRK